MEPTPTPDGIEPLHGYRLWIMQTDPLRLRSLWTTTLWPPREPLVATCLPTQTKATCDHERGQPIPYIGGRCGIYAVDSAADPQLARHVWRMYRGFGPMVHGATEGWGRVIKAERGWRAQYARPVCFKRDEAIGQDIYRLALAYDVPVVEELT